VRRLCLLLVLLAGCDVAPGPADEPEPTPEPSPVDCPAMQTCTPLFSADLDDTALVLAAHDVDDASDPCGQFHCLDRPVEVFTTTLSTLPSSEAELIDAYADQTPDWSTSTTGVVIVDTAEVSAPTLVCVRAFGDGVGCLVVDEAVSTPTALLLQYSIGLECRLRVDGDGAAPLHGCVERN